MRGSYLLSERAQNLNQIFLVALSAYAGQTCFRIKRGAQYRPFRYRELEHLAFRIASFLRREGAVSGERVVISARNSAEWMAGYLACQFCGAVAVPARHKMQSEDLCFIVRDSGAVVALVQGAEDLAGLDEVASQIPSLRSVLVFDSGTSTNFSATSLARVSTEKIAASELEQIRREAELVEADAVAAIQYTAEETGRLRGAVFTHRQRLESIRLLGEWIPLDRDDLAFSLLTWGYAPSLQFTLRCWLAGVPSVLAESRSKAFENLRQSSPTLAMVTPYGLGAVLQPGDEHGQQAAEITSRRVPLGTLDRPRLSGGGACGVDGAARRVCAG